MGKQVLSIEQMKELEILDIDISRGSMCWGKWETDDMYHLFAESKTEREKFIDDLIEHNCIDEEDAKEYNHNTIPTFTLQDILEMLPPCIKVEPINEFDTGYYLDIDFDFKEISYYDYIWDRGLISFEYDTLLDGAFQILKWCKENKYI